ncbi:PhzF family phenazine biosynthesis protein [Kytococcus sp. Marseille-QA3725]
MRGSNGPQWALVELEGADAVRAVRGSLVGTGLRAGLVGLEQDPAAGVAYEVRALTQVHEDAVTGSLNASVAQWMRERGRVPERYVAAQGSRVGRAGRIEVHDDGQDVWIGGRCVTRVTGELRTD